MEEKQRKCITEGCNNTVKENYQTCYECHKDKKREEKDRIQLDLNKHITVPVWAVLALLAVGIAIGATIW